MIKKIKYLIEEAKYSQLKQEIINLDEADIAEILEELDEPNIIKVFSILPKDIAAKTFSKLAIEYQQFIINSLTDKEAAYIIDEMAADDATDLIEEMPANMVKRILANTTPETRKDINHLLNYPDNSAGSIMTVEFLDIKADFTVSKAIDKIRLHGEEKETLDFCYVLDKERKLLGHVALKDIILSSENQLIGNIMEETSARVTTLTDVNDVVDIFQKYDITVVPVVDSEERLVGIITIDDIIDIMEEKTTEHIEKMAAIVPTEKTYLKLSLWDIFKSRIPWLLFLMIGATFTSQIISNYENALASYAVLISFIPMIMGTGGNAGGQSSATLIRALSLDEVKFKDIGKVTLKEFEVGIICGLTLAICNFIKLLIIEKVTVITALVVCVALLVTVILAKLIGAILPILADKLKLDPTVLANPIITTIVDALSLIVYFHVASLILGI